MESGFSVTCGIIVLKEKGVYRQALLKGETQDGKRFFPDDEIDNIFSDKPIDHITTLNLHVKENHVKVHCQKNDSYITKIMSCFGVPTEVEDHQTRQVVHEETYILKYPEAISMQNTTKHSVDDTKNDAMIPSALLMVIKPVGHQIVNSHFFSVTEVNAVNSQAQAGKMPAEPQIKFCKNLARCMMENNINDDGTKGDLWKPQ